LLLDCVFKVYGCAVEIRDTHCVNDHLNAIEINDDIVVQITLVKKELINQPRATTRLHCHPQSQIIATFLGEEFSNLICSCISELDPVCEFFFSRIAH